MDASIAERGSIVIQEHFGNALGILRASLKGLFDRGWKEGAFRACPFVGCLEP